MLTVDFALHTKENTTENLKRQLSNKLGIAYENLHLWRSKKYGIEEMEDGARLRSYFLRDGDTHLACRYIVVSVETLSYISSTCVLTTWYIQHNILTVWRINDIYSAWLIYVHKVFPYAFVLQFLTITIIKGVGVTMFL